MIIELPKVFMRHTDYQHMLKFPVLITFTIIIITLTVNPYLIPRVESTPSSYENNEGNEGGIGNGDSEPQENSPQDDSSGTSGSDENGDDDSNGNDDDNGIGPTDDQNPVGDDRDAGGVDEEPPTSTERGGNPLEGLNVGKTLGKAECEKYLKSLGGGDDTNIGDTIEDPFKTKEEICRGLLGGAPGIDILNTTMPTTSGLMNQTDLINNNNITEGDIIITKEGTSSPCIMIREEGSPSGPSRPQPQPSPSPRPC